MGRLAAEGVPHEKAPLQRWIEMTDMKLIETPTCVDLLATLLSRTFGSQPPLDMFDDWHGCLTGNLRLALERASRHLLPIAVG